MFKCFIILKATDYRKYGNKQGTVQWTKVTTTNTRLIRKQT